MAVRDDEVCTRRWAGVIRIMIICLRYKWREEEDTEAKKEIKDFHLLFKGFKVKM